MLGNSDSQKVSSIGKIQAIVRLGSNDSDSCLEGVMLDTCKERVDLLVIIIGVPNILQGHKTVSELGMVPLEVLPSRGFHLCM